MSEDFHEPVLKSSERSSNTNEGTSTNMAALAVDTLLQQDESRREHDVVRAETVAGAVNSERLPLQSDYWRPYSPTRENSNQYIAEKREALARYHEQAELRPEDRDPTYKELPIAARANYEHGIHEYQKLWRAQDAEVARKTEHYDSLYETNPAKFADMSVADFIETARTETSLGAEATLQQNIQTKIIEQAQDTIKDLEEGFESLGNKEIPTSDLDQLAQFGEHISKLVSDLKRLPDDLAGLSFHGATAGQSWGHSENERQRRKQWFAYEDQYGAEVDALRHELATEADSLKLHDAIAKVKTFADTLAQRQNEQVQATTKAHEDFIAEIKSEPRPEAA